jgi:tetratricopeptide (TPR) repeat protein
MHLYLPEQPDLNWYHQPVRDEFLDILRHWFERGVDGFRIDVAHTLLEDQTLRDNPLVGPTPGPYAHPRDAFAAYAHAYDLGAALLIHTGRADAALAGVEKAILAARRGDDPYRPVSFMGTYAWVLLHQGRYQEAEDLVVAAAENIEPRMSTTDQAQLAAWGGLMMQAGVMAGSDAHRSAADRLSSARMYLTQAESAAVRMDRDSRRYWISFGPTQLAVQSTHVYTVLERPADALRSSVKVDPGQLLTIQYGRHLLDVAQSQSLRRRTDDAIQTTARAQALSPEWFRHQKAGASLVETLRRRKARVGGPLADLVAAYRHQD